MNEQQKIDINISEEVAQGVYSNLVVITHSNAEFIMDFVAMMPGVPKANVRSRVVMTPQNAKRFLGALNENIKKFEEKNGPIKETAMDVPMIGNGGAQA
ncbi:DUF3467 domain-containing protein [Bacteroidales bacterium OttesenSCG-928-B11]|nr:DUF3467 domain-containing protein [Bacteroidales bacterium OttesenSCG-928-E04]MDL2312480.1 DUF3467 domain-containing protein [Bacteroidales bacterium OttesenSCG-928-B11]MDL2325711.1 DUF3467 domain-containing protein [Bacteroidales bacterium OttesenSCG-928-A14]